MHAHEYFGEPNYLRYAECVFVRVYLKMRYTTEIKCVLCGKIQIRLSHTFTIQFGK